MSPPHGEERYTRRKKNEENDEGALVPYRTDYLGELRRKKKAEAASLPRGCLVAPYQDRGIMYATGVGTLYLGVVHSALKGERKCGKTTGGLYEPEFMQIAI